jgi:hypothetical protein
VAGAELCVTVMPEALMWAVHLCAKFDAMYELARVFEPRDGGASIRCTAASS